MEGQSLSDSITGKRLALFVYLLVTGKPQPRDVLADLLWYDVPTRQAKKNLRDILPSLRKLLGEYLIITRQRIAFNRHLPYWLDVEVFGTNLSKQVTSDPMMLREVLNLYQGDFLAGFYLRKAPVFEEWALMQRQKLQKQVVDGLRVLANHYLAQADYAAGLATTQRLLALEPWDEQAHRLQMVLLAYEGQRSAALAQYATCRRVLAKEYGVPPLAETTILYEQIKLEKLVAHQPKAIASSASITSQKKRPLNGWHRNGKPSDSTATQSPRTVNWDAIPTPPQLHGRQSELATLKKWLIMDRSQLVGLFALGGQGKTALVAHLVHDLADSGAFSDLPHSTSVASPNSKGAIGFERIVWYSLVSRPTLTELLDYFLQSLLPSQSRQPITLTEQLQTLVDCLRRQRCLLVLDHVEQIMQHATGAGRYQPDYELYGEFWRWVAQSQHKSGVMVISREQPQEWRALERQNSAVRSLQLTGLSMEAGVQMWRTAGLPAQDDLLASLVKRYSGHPLALRLMIETTQELQLDDLGLFLEPLIFDDLYDLLGQYFSRLSATEREILIGLASEPESIDSAGLWKKLSPAHSKRAILEAQRSLRRRSLLAFEPRGVMKLPNIVLAYTREHLL
ncbi:MAG: AfsR/SARP family transcriptional regulator [Ardenticatenaceae bacterium]